MNTIPVWLARLVAFLRPAPAIGCGDCPRSPRCGLPPSDDCVVRLELAERTGDLRPFA